MNAGRREAARRLCKKWKELWPDRWVERCGRHLCNPGCNFARVLDDVRVGREVPDSRAQFAGAEDDLWLCLDSGLPHLCGLGECDAEVSGTDREPTCAVTGRVLGQGFDPGWQFSARAREQRNAEWVPAPALHSITMFMPPTARGRGFGASGARERRFVVQENEWKRFASSGTEGLTAYLVRLCASGWHPDIHLGPGAARAWGTGAAVMLIRAVRVLACIFARTPQCPLEQRILRVREARSRAARAHALDPERGFAVLAELAEETWVPGTARARAELVLTLARATTGLWAQHLGGELEIPGGHAPIFEKFVLAAASVLGTGVDVEFAGVRFASLEADPRLARLPIAEVAELLGEAREAHNALVVRLRDGILRAAVRRPSIFRDLYYRPAPSGVLARPRRSQR